MARIFLSYDREDAVKAQGIALALETAGHSVWWDRHIKGGAQYSKEIEAALTAAEAVVVLWSKQSVDSAWVRDEAAAGRDSGRLVPVVIDGTEPPLGFRQYQSIDLSRWKGRGKALALNDLFDTVSALSTSPTPAPPPSKPRRRPGFQLENRRIVVWAAALLGALMMVALVAWRPWSKGPSIPTVAVAASDPSPYARELARDLVTKLGRLQVANPTSMSLAGGNEPTTKATFVFEVGGSVRGQQAFANLVLITGVRRAILWSKDFQQPRANQSDLRQQVAVSAASVLDCAQEAATSGTEVDQQTLKLYLNGCATLAEVYDYYAGVVIPVFLEVTKRAPRFKDAWAKLLIAEAQVAAFDSTPKGPATAAALKQHLVVARALDPQMAEAFYADIQLLPGESFKQRVQIADKALALHPDNPSLLGVRSELMQGLGRMNEAVAQSKRASDLDALSPAARSSYISALTYAGFTESALEELKQADNLWPGAGPLIDARFRLQARYGDPKEAVRIMRSVPEPGIPRIFEAFLSARIDPTPSNIDRAVADASALVASDPDAIAILIQALGEFGSNDQIYAAIKNWRGTRVDGLRHAFFRPALRNFRRDPRFMQVAKRMGLIEYWHQSGKWPDFCFEADLPYDCKAEAAKIAA